MIGARIGHFLDRPLAPLARALRLSPNTLSVSGFAVNVAAAFAISRDLVLGGILVLVGGLFDVLDGVVARTNGKATEFGAFLDSVLDRFSDGLLFLGVAWYMHSAGDDVGALLSMGSLLGAYGISYARARAEGLGKECRTGLMERPERIVLLALGALTGWMTPVLWVMFVLSSATFVQRVHHVWKQCSNS